MPTIVMLAMVLSIFNIGTYNPQNELQVFTPDSASAAFAFGGFFGGDKDEAENEGAQLEIPALSFETESLDKDFEIDTVVIEVKNDNNNLDLSQSSIIETNETNKTETSSSYKSEGLAVNCDLEADTDKIFVGGSVTLSWDIEGYTNITINGQTVSGTNGSKIFENVQENTSYTLIAKTADGKSSCINTVKITCLPMPALPPACTELGYDFEIARYEWTGDAFSKMTEADGYNTKVLGNSRNASWSSDKEVAGVIAKAAKDYGTFPGGLKGSISRCDIGGGCDGISFVQLCGNLPPPPPVPAPVCTLNPANKTVNYGDSVVLNWTTQNAKSATLTNFGEVYLNGEKNTGALTASQTYTLNVLGEEGKEVNCVANIKVNPKVEPAPLPVCDLFEATPNTIVKGNEASLSWKTTNAKEVAINNGIGKVGATDKLTIKPLATTKYVLTATNKDGKKVSCETTVKVEEPPVEKTPMCTIFDARPFALPFGGGKSTINWITKDASQIVIDNGIGKVDASGQKEVTVTKTTTFTLTASDGKKSHSCFVTIDVEPEPIPAPVCTLEPANQTIDYDKSAVLTWTTKNAKSATLTNFGEVYLNGEKNTGELKVSQTYTLEVLGNNGQTVTCQSNVKVNPQVDPKPETPTPISCAANVNFTTSAKEITKGDKVTLNWTTNKIKTVSFDNGVTATDLNGSVEVTPSSNTTYTLKASDGKDTVSCPVTVTVKEPTTPTTPTTPPKTSGGGGGGSVAPTCELTVSKKKISQGEEVKLTWDSNRATGITIKDNNGKVVVSTDDVLASARKELLSGSKTLKPATTTTYTMTVERGSIDRSCKVVVEVEKKKPVVVESVRDQDLVSEIYLSEVPYTGFEAGPILTTLFYALLAAWALFISYFLVVRKDKIGGYQLATPNNAEVDAVENNIPTGINPDLFVASVQAPEVGAGKITVPANLPTGNVAIGFGNNGVESSTNLSDKTVTEIENYAHIHRVLVSSDAIRHFVSVTANDVENRIKTLDKVITTAKSQYPAEDGWIVLNEKRMRDLCEVCSKNEVSSNSTPFAPVVIPEGSGSLAEAIVTGNIVAAYELIGNRPMFALADATSDLDSVYRNRKGDNQVISDLLVKETENLSDEELLAVIESLTSALDGTYTNEQSAVKMAIMKAVKIASKN